jgi:hypothetical protein
VSDPRAVFLAAHEAAAEGPFDVLLYGGMAAALWGEPRYTQDVDLVVFIPERHAYKFLRAAGKHGFSVDEDVAIQQIQVSGWARLPFGGPKSPWHLDLTLGDSPFDKSAFARRRQVRIFGTITSVVSPEDLVLYKLVSDREQDRVDVRAVFKRQPSLDAAYLRKWARWWEQQGIQGIVRRLESEFAG